MVRKEFIKHTSLLLGGAVLSPLAGIGRTAVPAPSSTSLKKALSYYMIKEDLPLIDKLMLVKDLGFEGVEFNTPLEFSVKELLEAKKKSGIEIPSTVNADHWSKPLSDPDPAVRKHIIGSISKSLDQTLELGGDTLLVVPGVVSAKVSYEQAYNNSLNTIRDLIPHVERTGIKIGLENVWSNFILSPLEAKRFVDDIGHPQIGWYFDIGNILRYGWPEHWIETLGHRIFKLHAKEFSREKMNNEGLGKGFNVDIGQGDIDWPVVMKALEKVGYNGGWLTAEVKAGDRNYLRQVAQQLEVVIKGR